MSPAPPPTPALDRWFFLRFQKTGGTALTIRLRELFGADAVYPTTEDHGNVEAVFSVDHLLAQVREHGDDLRVLSGHFPLCVLDRLDRPYRTFTVLREPVERTLSLLRSRAQRGGERFLGRPLEEIYEHPEIQDIARNHMVKMLSLTADEMEGSPLLQPLEMDDQRLATAVARLTELEVVGLQERFDDFCAALEARFGWDLGPERVANRTADQPVSDALRRRIAEDNALDVALYDHVRAQLASTSAPAARTVPPVGEGKIVITGTGRSGTTLLVQLLDELGLDTGMREGKLSAYSPSVRAGLESRIDDPDAPRVVKDMTLGFRLRDLLGAGGLRIDHVLLPDRRLDVAAASRIRAARYGSRAFGRGALTGTIRATEQTQVLEGVRTELLATLADHEIPHTVLEFPRFATDAEYLCERLRPVLPRLSPAEVQAALDRCVHPEMIHEAPLSRGERWRTQLTTAWMVLYRYPVARLRHRLDPEGQEARLRASVAAARRREAELAEVERRAGRYPGTSAGGAPPPA